MGSANFRHLQELLFVIENEYNTLLGLNVHKSVSLVTINWVVLKPYPLPVYINIYQKAYLFVSSNLITLKCLYIKDFKIWIIYIVFIPAIT